MNRGLLFLFIQFVFCAAFAQNFKYKAKITEVKKDGFFKIQLSPEIVAKSKYQLADLRLTSFDGKEIPFILNSEPPKFYEQDFIPFGIEENTSKGNVQTLIISNPNQQSINNLVLEIKNVYGEKKIRINGSDDKKNWYMLHQGFTFAVPGDANNTRIYQAIDFPMADYKWFSISFIDTMPLSLNILRVGNYKQKIIFGNYTSVPGIIFRQMDSSDKKSYLTIKLEEPNFIDKIGFSISKPEQFLRKIWLSYEKFSGEDDGSYSDNSGRQLLELNSEQENAFTFSDNRKISEMKYIIENNDNQPLLIDSIKIYQLKNYLIAKLETGKTYFLQFGDSTLEVPDYDLKYFENKIPRDIQIINHLAVEANPNGILEPKEKTSNRKIYIWIGLIAAGLLLAFMTGKMLKEVKSEKANE